MQTAGQILDPNQFYYAPMPAQPTAAPPGMSYQYTGGFYGEPYMMASAPAQPSQAVMMPVGTFGLSNLKVERKAASKRSFAVQPAAGRSSREQAKLRNIVKEKESCEP
ncbi:unnamed protein product [Strongylus vulgaris]|uniref:Uncharacterized protein n=1 Tax=Strongylus vulgaris TaxID=40348 RepID=A0A3P7JB38_STRVU|nr:unnamed protein product [Strongylus vulgaris]